MPLPSYDYGSSYKYYPSLLTLLLHYIFLSLSTLFSFSKSPTLMQMHLVVIIMTIVIITFIIPDLLYFHINLVLKNVDELLTLKLPPQSKDVRHIEFAAAPDLFPPDRFNAGFILLLSRHCDIVIPYIFFFNIKKISNFQLAPHKNQLYSIKFKGVLVVRPNLHTFQVQIV